MKFVPEPFQITFCKISIDNWYTKKQKFKLLLENNVQLFWTQENGGYKSTFDDIDKTQYLTQSMLNIIEEDLIKLNDVIGCELKCVSSWFQIYNELNTHPVHNHGNIGWSGILFINFIEAHRPPIFFSPFLSVRESSVIEYIPEIKEGDFLLFPSNILHYVPSHSSKVTRIISSFNFSES